MARARTGSSDLTRTLAACPQPVYLLNSRRAIVYANTACADWLGIDAEQLLGARCDYHSGDVDNPSQAIAAGLCPPPEAFTAARGTGVVTALRDGKLEEREAEFFALAVPDEPSPSLLAIVAAGPRAIASAPRDLKLEEPSSAELHVLLRWLRQTQSNRPALERWVGDSPLTKRVRLQFAAAAATQARVLIVGPRGSGRSELARGLHYRQSHAKHAPLVAIDCATADAESLQMAITSLVRGRAAGIVAGEPAATVLLEDIDKLPPGAQRELLGFLEVPGFEVRTLATAVEAPLTLVRRGEFDRALALAISTITIELPSLRERLADLPLLAQTLVEELNAGGGKQLSGLTAEALDRLAVYSWPGDMAQLAGAIKEAWTAASGTQIVLADLPRWLSAAEDAAARPPRVETKIVLDDFLADVERELLARALARVRGNKSKAARLLGISRPRLLRRMEQLGLNSSHHAPP